MSILQQLLHKILPFRAHPIQAILFDLDGTLIDSEPVAALAVQRFFSNFKITLTSEDASFVSGRKWEAALDYLLSRYPIPLERENVEKILLREYRLVLHQNVPIIPGGSAAILDLSQHFQLGLVSGSHKQDILWALESLNVKQCFKVILGAEDYAQSKPMPDGYWKAAEMLGIPVESCLVFEDSEVGIESARKAGMWVAAITAAHHFDPKPDLSQAHIKIPDFKEVNTRWVKKLTLSSV